jgi:hypothetical protein
MDKDTLIQWWRNGDVEAIVTQEFLKHLGTLYTARVPKLEEIFAKFEGIGARTACRLQDDEIDSLTPDLSAIEEEWEYPEDDADSLIAIWDEGDEFFCFQLIPPAEMLKLFEEEEEN